MVTEESADRWPFSTAGPPLTTRSFDPDGRSSTTAFVEPAAEALDADPLALPALNDRIDPDSVDRLLATFPPGPKAGVRVAVEASWKGVSVLVRDDGRVTVYRGGSEPNQLEATTTVEHDWSGHDPLLWSIGRAVAADSDGTHTEVAESLVQWVDADAIDRLLRPLADGTERTGGRLLLSLDGYEVAVHGDGSIAVEPTLSVLKRSGATLLLAGSVPERSLDRAAATLLGNSEDGCAPVFVHHGRDLETAQRRLSMAGLTTSEGTVLDHSSTARAATASDGDGAVDFGPEVVPVAGGVQALPGAVRETIEAAEPVSPGTLRVSVDSVRAMLDSNGFEETRDVLESICRTVHERRGIGHFVLPTDPDDEEVASLVPSFDAVVELRMGDVGVEQRWRLTGTGHETEWFSVG